MPLSTLNLKFLLDENVRIELARFLKDKNFDVKLAPKSISDYQLAQISKTEKRILVTNDYDFTQYSKDQVFSVIWLRLPQSETQSLIISFDKMVKEIKYFSGKLVVLKDMNWEELPLAGREESL